MVSSGDPMKTLQEGSPHNVDKPFWRVVTPVMATLECDLPNRSVLHTSTSLLSRTLVGVLFPTLTPLSSETPVTASGLNPCKPRPPDRWKYTLNLILLLSQIQWVLHTPKRDLLGDDD